MLTRPSRFTWLLPLVWIPVCAVNYQFLGDEYGGFGVGSAAGLWILLVNPISDASQVLAPVLITGAATMAVAGLMLDRLRIPFLTWLSLAFGFAFAFGIAWLQTFSTWQRSLGKNGSWLAYLLPSINVGLTTATMVMIIAFSLFRLIEWAFQGRSRLQNPHHAV